VVSWQLPTTLEAAVLTAALARLGAVANPVIPALRSREVSFIVRQVRPELFCVPGEWRGFDHRALALEVTAGTGADVLVVDHRTVHGPGLALPAPAPGSDGPGLPAAPTSADDVRWLYHTSGTTSVPKGVRHTDTSVIAGSDAWVAALRPGPDDLYPIAFPVTHIGGAVTLSAALRTGLRLLLLDSFDPVTSPVTMAAHDPTLLGSAAPFLNAYLAAQRAYAAGAAGQTDGAARLFPRLRACTSGGTAKPAGLHRRVADELGGVGIVSSWGLTEFPLATHGSPDDSDDELDRTEGRPGPRVRVKVVAADGSPCAPGAEGELLLHGPQLFAGYLDPELDAAAFDADGFFRTGDLGSVGPNGHVRIAGRRKDVVIRNAENISAVEVEEVLVTHPAVADVAVIGLPDPRTGERCCAVVVLAAGVAGPPTLADLGAHCAAAGLARHKAPEQLEIVDSLPRTGMGKVAKQPLRARFATV
jgi:acyl-CoA synthetase (AMP-forming)/AMP-acid ligase II